MHKSGYGRVLIVIPFLAILILLFAPQSQARAQIDPGFAPPGPLLVIEGTGTDSNTFVPPVTRSAGETTVTTANFVVTYSGFTPAAQAAFQYAVDIWSAQITSNIIIYVDANWTPLGGSTLGSAGTTGLWRDFAGAPQAGTWYPVALAEMISNSNLNTDGNPDINANFNSTASWYLGTDGNPPGGQYDFATVVLHELGHGLGFFGSMIYDDGAGTSECAGVGGQGCWGGGSVFPYAYDQFAEDGSGIALLNTGIYPNPSAALGTAITGGDVFFDSPDATVVNGGTPPELYAPGAWNQGSSYSHLDETVYPAGDPDSLMTPQLGTAEAIHDPGAIALCMFSDMGWDANCNPVAVWDGGGVTNNWSEAANWSNDQLPLANTGVTFDATSTKSAIIDGGFAGAVGDFLIDTGFSGTITQTSTLTINGSLIQMDGTFTATSGTLVFDGSDPIESWSMLPGHAFGDVQIGGSNAPLVEQLSSLNIDGDLSFAGGGLSLGSQGLNLAGSLSDTGTAQGLASGSGTINFDGTTQTIDKVSTYTVLQESFDDAIGECLFSAAFLPAGWIQEQSSGFGFLAGDLLVCPPGGNGVAVRWNNSTEGWLHSLPLVLVAGVDYELEYKVAEGVGGDSEDYEVYLGDAPASANMTTMISSISNVSTTSFTTQIDSFTVPTTAVYYLGFWSQQDAGAGFALLDDIVVRATADLNNVQIASPSVTVLAADTAVSGNVIVNPGATLDLGGQALTVEGAVTNNGTLSQTLLVNNADVAILQILDSAGSTTKYHGVEVFADSFNSNLGDVSASVRELNAGEYCTSTGPGSPAYAQRCFRISPQFSDTAVLRLWALTSEIPGTIVTPTVYHDVSGSGNWVELTIDAATGSVGPYSYAEGRTDSFSPFLMADAGGGALTPTAVTLQSLNVRSAVPLAAPFVVLLGGVGTWFLLARRRRPIA